MTGEVAIWRFLRRRGIQGACCSSCHGDDEYGYDMCSIDIRRGTKREEEVCCCCNCSSAWDEYLEGPPKEKKA